jgi:outer membrane scaffolding protein for murein synthesis (MipA/OmpV family)
LIVKIALAAWLVSLPALVNADSLPLWEIGLGGGVLRIPDYRGAQDARVYPYPFAIPFYRGKYLRSDEDGVRGEVLVSKRVKFDFSLDGNVPVKSDDALVRQGMPDLAPTFQIGPALNIKLWHSAQERSSFIAFLPLRVAIAVDFPDLHHIGYTFSPRLNFNRKVDLFSGQWRMGIGIGLEYGSETFHDYYYQVDPQYTTPTRPAYDAQGGFAGYRSIFTFYRRFTDMWVSFYGRYDRIDNAVFEESPLAVRKDGTTVGFLVTWILFKSETMVEERDWKYY